MAFKGEILLTAMVVLAAIFTSCGKVEEETPDRAWRAEEIELPEKYQYKGKVLGSDGDFLIDGWLAVDPEHPEIESHGVILRVDALTGEFGVENPGNPDGTLARAGFDGVVCIVSGELSEDNNRYDSLKLSVESGGNVTDYDCGELFGLNISSLSYDSNAGGFYIRLIAGTKDEIYVVSNTGAVRLGSTVSCVQTKQEIRSAALTDEGLIIFTDERGGIYSVNFASGGLDKITLPTGDSAMIKPFPLDGYLFGGVITDRIYGYKRVEGKLEAELICDLNDVGIAGETSGAAAEEGVICVSIYDGMDARKRFFRLTETEPIEKKTLTLAFVGNIGIRENYAVAEFNRTHDDVRLEMKRYESTPDENGRYDQNEAIERFGRDIVAGDIPDILISRSDADLEGYAGKGLFADLYGLMDDAKKNDLMPFVKSFETSFKGGKGLYYLPLCSKITSLVGRESDFPDGLTLEVFLDKLENPESGRTLRSMRFGSLVYESIGSFVDFETKKLSFDSELFRRFANDFKKYTSERFNSAADDFANGKLLLTRVNVDVRSLVLLKVGDGVDDLAILGYPGGEPTVEPAYYLGVTKDCADIAAARDYINLRISEKYLLHGNSDPYLTRSAFESYINSQDRYYCFSASGNKCLSYREKPTGRRLEAIPEQIGAGYLEYELEDDIIAMVKDSLGKAQPESDIGRKAADILLEELDTYASRAGQKLDDTIKIITDRVGNLLSEKE